MDRISDQIVKLNQSRINLLAHAKCHKNQSGRLGVHRHTQGQNKYIYKDIRLDIHLLNIKRL